MPDPFTEQEAARRALRESEERYRSLVELLPDAVVAYRGERISFANPAAARLFGAADAVALIGTRIVDWLPAEEREPVRRPMASLAAGESFPLQAQVLVRADGARFHAEGAAVPLESGEVLLVLRHVTERERARAGRAG